MMVLGWWCCCQPATAQLPEDAHAAAAARALFHEGVACADARDWACAADRFGRARAVHPSPVILSNHGIALDHLGRLVEASEAFRAVLRDASASPDLRAQASHAVELITPRIGSVTVIATGPTEGVAFSMDGQPLDASLLGVAVPSDPGAHRLEVRRADAIVVSREVDVAAGRNARLELAIPAPVQRHAVSIGAAMDATLDSHVTSHGPAADPICSSVAAASHHEVYDEWWFWTILGVVVVGAGAGVTAAVVTSNESTLPMGSVGTIDVRP
jgi:hypothetical protein